MKQSGAVRYSLYVLVAIVAMGALWRYGLSGRVVTSYTLVCDSRLHSATCDYLTTQIPALITQNYTPDYIHQKHLIRKHRTHSAVKVKAYTPCVLVSNTMLVTLEGILIPAHHYRADISEKLPAVQLHERDARSLTGDECRELAAWASQVPLWIKRYRITWKNPTEIHLFLKNYPDIPVIITRDTPLTQERAVVWERLAADDKTGQIDARFSSLIVTTQKNIKNKKRRKEV